MDFEVRPKNKIESLDKLGKEILLKIKSEWNKDITSGETLDFHYFSEDFFKFL